MGEIHAWLLCLLLLSGTEGLTAAKSAEEGDQGGNSHSTSPADRHDDRRSHDLWISCCACRLGKINGSDERESRWTSPRLRSPMKDGMATRDACARYDCYLPSMRDCNQSADLQEELLRKRRDNQDGFSDAAGWQRHLVYVTVSCQDDWGGVHVTLYFRLTRAGNSKGTPHATPGSESLATPGTLLGAAPYLLLAILPGVAEAWRRRRRIGEGLTRQRRGRIASSELDCGTRASQEGENGSQPTQTWETEPLSDDLSEKGAKSDLAQAASTSDGKTAESSRPCEEEQGCLQSPTPEPSAKDDKSSVPLESEPQPSPEPSTTPPPSAVPPERRPELSPPITLRDIVNQDPGAYMRSLHCDEIARIFRRAVTPTLQSHVTKGNLTEEASAALLERHVSETRDLADQWMERWQRGSPETLMLSDVWATLLSMRKAAIFKEVQGLVRASSLRG